MSLETMTPTAWSLVASVVSVLLAVLAILLSVWFFVEANKASKTASETLAKVETAVKTIEQHAFGVLELTINKITGLPTQGPMAEATLTAARLEGPGDSKEAVELRPSPLDSEVEKLNKLYSALAQLENPFFRALGNVMGNAVSIEHERLRALIAIQQAKLEKEYGVKLTDPALQVSKQKAAGE